MKNARQCAEPALPEAVADARAFTTDRAVPSAKGGPSPKGKPTEEQTGLLLPGQRMSMSRTCELMLARDHRAPTGRALRRRMAKLARKLGIGNE